MKDKQNGFGVASDIYLAPSDFDALQTQDDLEYIRDYLGFNGRSLNEINEDDL